MDDRALATALAGGSETAFHQLVDDQTGPVFRTCFRILGSVEEAEDATQETFVLAYRALASYRGDGPPGAWLSRIAVRESWRRARLTSRQVTRTSPLDETVEATTPDPTDVARDVVAAEERAQVRRALEELPEPYQEVVSLRFLGDRSLAEIAQVTGRPEATVKTHLYRGLARLRALLGDERP